MNSSFSNTRSNAYSVIHNWNECNDFIKIVKHKKPHFLLALGGTETALLPGLSSAGRNTEALKSTPALDAEYLVLDKGNFTKGIPVSPSGIPSPVVLTRPIIKMLDLNLSVVDAGCFVKPECNHISLNMGQGKCISTGNSLDPIKVKFLLQKGEKLATSLKDEPYIVIGECIPGGTTTALSVLCALGIEAFNLVSSSDPEGNHMIKNLTVKDALLNNVDKFASINSNPIKALEYFGDPVQVFIAGFILGAQKINLPILLAGGSQMIAIYYLVKKILGRNPYDLIVGTTSWIAKDQDSNLKLLAELTDTPVIASNLSFKDSSFPGLKAYEEGHIKEGVGAGGIMIAASLYKDIDTQKLSDEIERDYNEISKTIDLESTSKSI